MVEAIKQVVQVGRQSSLGTSVAATQVLPIEAGWPGFTLNRNAGSPDNDYGRASREAPGTGTTGLRMATAPPVTIPMRFGDVQKLFEMHLATISAPTGSSPYVWDYVADESTGLLSAALKSYTWEYGDPDSTQDEYEAVGVIINRLTIGFDALSTSGNQMWRAQCELIALDRVAAAMTGGLSAPTGTALEQMEGHKTTLAEGDTSTVFASLSALGNSLKQFELVSDIKGVIRAYGGSTDIGVSYGRSAKAELTGSAQLVISSTTKTDIHDVFAVASAVQTERRWRIDVDGEGNNDMKIDFRPRFTAVDRSNFEGEILYAADFVGVYDSTLTSRAKFSLTNDVSAHA